MSRPPRRRRRPLGTITHISAVAVGGGGAPRVLAAAASGAAIEWDLHGGGACRRLHMPAGLQAIARDARVQGETPSNALPRPGSIWFGKADGSLQLWRWRRPLPHLHGSARLAEAAGPATAYPPASSTGRDAEAHPLAMASYVPAPAAKSPGGKAKVKVEEFEREEEAPAPMAETISWLQSAANDAANAAGYSTPR